MSRSWPPGERHDDPGDLEPQPGQRHDADDDAGGRRGRGDCQHAERSRLERLEEPPRESGRFTPQVAQRDRQPRRPEDGAERREPHRHQARDRERAT